jgi:hypothetical protein
MKATLEFDLPDERTEHRCAVNGVKYDALLHELWNDARCALKHGHAFKDADAVFEWLRTFISENAEEIFEA